MVLKRRRLGSAAAAVLAACCALGVTTARAVTIEIDDVAPDRVERQRAYAEGSLPLAGTPDLARLKERLAEAGVKAGDPLFIRIFKAESELELWVQKGGQFTLFATYPICHWAGTIGPKLREGDRQNPEGFYSVGSRQLHRIGRWPRSLNLGFPNSFDKAHGRTGSYILVHGGCSSVGCYAMTNAVMAEIFGLVEESLKRGQQRVDVHVFPFRMTEGNLSRHAGGPWSDFWANLKEGYDAFEATRVPPRVGLCDKRYAIERAGPEEVAAESPLASCGVSRAAVIEPSSQSLAALPQQWPQSQEEFSPLADPTVLDWAESKRLAARLQRRNLLPQLQHAAVPTSSRLNGPGALVSVMARAPRRTASCNTGLASCRRFLALQAEIDRRKIDKARLAGGHHLSHTRNR